jgi:hypothetical protein
MVVMRFDKYTLKERSKEILDRIMIGYGVEGDVMAFAKIIGVTKQAVQKTSTSGVPAAWVLKAAIEKNIDIKWMMGRSEGGGPFIESPTNLEGTSSKHQFNDEIRIETSEPQAAKSLQKYEHLSWKFQHIFDYLIEAHDDDTISTNNFLTKLENDFLMKDPDYRLWKYQKREEADNRKKKREAENYKNKSMEYKSANGAE